MTQSSSALSPGVTVCNWRLLKQLVLCLGLVSHFLEGDRLLCISRCSDASEMQRADAR